MLLTIIQYLSLPLLGYMKLFIGETLINLLTRCLDRLMLLIWKLLDFITPWMLVFNEGFKLPKNSERYLIVWHAKGIAATMVA